MNETEASLLSALQELDQTVRQMREASPKPNLLPLFERIDTLTKQLPRGSDPELLHFLQKRSYEKARLRLEGRKTENARGNRG